MSRKATKVFKAALSVLHYTGLGRLFAPLTRGEGVFLTLHRVSPEPPGEFEPNRILKVTPEFLETAIREVQAKGYEIVSLDAAARRMKDGAGAKPFACFTFDDGYRDNRIYAYPIFKRLNLPFAIYIPTAYADWQGDLWWLKLEEAIRSADELTVTLEGQVRQFETATARGKWKAFTEIYWTLRALPERELRACVSRIAREAGYDASHLCADMIMSWDEIRALAEDPLVTIGAHTRHHYALAKLSDTDARTEIALSVRRIEQELGRPCVHFSYPYGDVTSAGEREFTLARELGLVTAVTTRKGVITSGSAGLMTGLPRVSLNGDYQKARYVEVMLTGLPFTLRNFAARAITPAVDAVKALSRRPDPAAASTLSRRLLAAPTEAPQRHSK
jgi:peptidoglycan/xylan/chitin deacetylase (PgdA/CDA1 family)